MLGDALSPEESDALLANIRPWLRPTTEQVRNVVLQSGVLAVSDPEGHYGTGSVRDQADEAIRNGRLFDLGVVSWDAMQREAERAVDLFADGHIGHPFRDTYAFFHRWAMPGGPEVGGLFMVDPHDWYGDTQAADLGFAPRSFLVAELVCCQVAVDGPRVLMVGACGIGTTERDAGGVVNYAGRAHDAPPPLERREWGHKDVLSFLLDRAVACMLLLATDGVTVERIEPSAKLNKARAKAGKPAIPAHFRVDTGPYITALMHRGQRQGEPGAGHHASPIPHLRRGHVRRLQNGRTVWVRDSLVNLKDPTAPLARSFYELRK